MFAAARNGTGRPAAAGTARGRARVDVRDVPGQGRRPDTVPLVPAADTLRESTGSEPRGAGRRYRAHPGVHPRQCHPRQHHRTLRQDVCLPQSQQDVLAQRQLYAALPEVGCSQGPETYILTFAISNNLIYLVVCRFCLCTCVF